MTTMTAVAAMTDPCDPTLSYVTHIGPSCQWVVP